MQSSQPPKGNSLCKNTSYDIQIVKFGPTIFAQLTLLSNPENPVLSVLFNRLDTPKVPIPVAASTLHVIHVPWTHTIHHRKLHLCLFSHFAQLTAGPYALRQALKHN